MANIEYFLSDTNILKILYVGILVYAALQILFWTWRRLSILIDLKHFSMAAVFKLAYCVIFLILTLMSLSNVFASGKSFKAHPYIILIMSTNFLYVNTTLGTSFFKKHKKSRLVTCSILFTAWCVIGTIIFISNIFSVGRTPYSLVGLNDFVSFGWEIYGKITPFWLMSKDNSYIFGAGIAANVFNMVCLLILIIYSKIIPEIKSKLYSWKYLFFIDLFLILRDLSYVVFHFSGFEIGVNFPTIIIGSILSATIIGTATFYSLFIRSEGKYDRNLKRQRVKTLKKDLNTIISDFDNSQILSDKVECVRRLKYLILRNKIMESKLNVVQLTKRKSPGLYSHFIALTNEEITLETIDKSTH